MAIEFTMTACCRPGILRDSLESFKANLTGVDLRCSTLFVNVDPLPAESSPLHALAVASSYFGRVCANLPTQPSFPQAIKWLWKMPRGATFFHLEDDWLLRERVDVRDMEMLLEADASLSVVNLRAYAHHDDRICLAPGLWRADHGAAIADRLSPLANPELQLRAHSSHNVVGGVHVGFRGIQHPDRRVIQDIGRAWLLLSGYERAGRRAFVKWKKKT